MKSPRRTSFRGKNRQPSFANKGSSDPSQTPSSPTAGKEKTMPYIEIVSCKGLLQGDKSKKSSDPYVKVKLGGKDIHRTKRLLQTINPIYTKKNDNHFVLGATKEDVIASQGLTLKIKDWDRLKWNDSLGHVQVPADILFGENKKAKTHELKIIAPSWSTSKDAGTITIKCRNATQADIEEFYSKETKHGSAFDASTLKKYGSPDLHLLIEIVSCIGLLPADLTASDPYVKVFCGRRQVHETKYIDNTLNPIFTIAHNSLFILDITKRELNDSQGLFFRVVDKDIMFDDDLGYVLVSDKSILEADGERMEFKLTPAAELIKQVEEKKEEKEENGEINNYDIKDEDDSPGGYLIVRIRKATQYDRDFLKHSARGTLDKFLNISKLDHGLADTQAIEKASRKGPQGLVRNATGGRELHLVRPCPDPKNITKTRWMTEQQITQESLKPSRKWLDCGSGDLGRLHVEVIGAYGLPNKDNGKDKTDPFVVLVYEDAVVRTEEIQDCLSPRFMPWTQRAFIFRMMNGSSCLHVGVFDTDPRFHELCGRASVDFSNLHPDTEYMLEYNLYENTNWDRTPTGTIILRIRFTVEDQKQLILSSVPLPEDVYVCVRSEKDFDVVHKTVNGNTNLQKYGGKDLLMKFKDELLSYLAVKYYVTDAIISLLFWRGQVPVFGIFLPIHSFILFIMSVTVVENLSLYPSYFFFSIAWFLLSIQIWKNTVVPNPWTRTKTFVGMTSTLVHGNTKALEYIPPHYKEEETQQYEDEIYGKIKKIEEEAEKRQKDEEALMSKHQALMSNVGDQSADTDIGTHKSGISLDVLDPLKPILYPIQLQVVSAMSWVRFLKNVIMWDEPNYAYLIVAVTLALSLILFIFPWGFFLRWISRIVAWGAFGPHMKLVDMLWFSKRKEPSEEEIRTQRQAELKAMLQQAKENAKTARIQRENAEKYRDMKAVIFGKYLTKVPLLRMERHLDFPLHTSEAKPYKENDLQMASAQPERIVGQKLVGEMIPTIILDDMATAIAASQRKKKVSDKKEK